MFFKTFTKQKYFCILCYKTLSSKCNSSLIKMNGGQENNKFKKKKIISENYKSICMGSSTEKSKVLIFGGGGYLGKYLINASLSLGHQTHTYGRPIKSDAHPSKFQLLKHFQSMGVIIHQGELDEHDKLVSILKEVDIVISALAVPQHLQQLNIIKAIKEAGNIKRFIPSEFGNEVDRVLSGAEALPPFQKLLDNKKKIRRATEEAGIPFTYVAANSFAAYFVNYLILHNSSHQITIYGNGEAKAVLNYEEDVAAYTLRAASDPRLMNRVIIYRPPKNIVSQLDLVEYWEKITGHTFQRIHVSEQQIISLSQKLAFPENIPPSILHNIFVAGSQMSYELTENDLEASELYPDYNYTSVHHLLQRCLLNPPDFKFAAFA